jgi:hypothetical protein
MLGVAFGSLSLPLESMSFLLLGALLCCGFAALRALPRFLGPLRGFGLAFGFLSQGTLVRGFAGGGR